MMPAKTYGHHGLHQLLYGLFWWIPGGYLDEKMASRPDDAMTIAIACHDHSEIKFIIPCEKNNIPVYICIYSAELHE